MSPYDRLGALRSINPKLLEEAPEGDQTVAPKPLVISPNVIGALLPILTARNDAAGLPLTETQAGNVFKDGGDSSISWYLPAYTLSETEDAKFAFAASQDGIPDEQGKPFNHATLTLGLEKVVPADVQAAQTAAPEATFREIPLAGLSASLLLNSKAQDGTDRVSEHLGAVVADGNVATVTIPGLIGSDVVVAFANFTETQNASLELRYTYEVATWVDDSTPEGNPVFIRDLHLGATLAMLGRDETPAASDPTAAWPVQLSQMHALRTAALRTDLSAIRYKTLVGDVPAAPPRVAVHQTIAGSVRLSLGSTYAGPSYRPRFTLTTTTGTRGIVSGADLTDFHVQQSEYQEVTVLGNIGSKYPSLRSVYLGQVSGNAIAIPASYGIVRTSAGCEASCHAIVDASATKTSGCSFQFAMTLGPIVDRAELAKLEADMKAEPTLAGRVTSLSLPSDIDRRTPSVLQVAGVDAIEFGSGLHSGQFQLTFDIRDDTLPAIVQANQLLAQLASQGAPSLLGHLVLRLDDAHDPPVTANVVLSLADTAGSDELALVVDQTGATLLVSNLSPLDLRLISQTAHGLSGFESETLNQVVPGHGSVPLPIPPGVDQMFVDRTLALPENLVGDAENRYVKIVATTIQQVRQVIGFNAADQFDHGIAKIGIMVALDAAPTLPVPVIELSPDHQLDQAAIEIPVGFVMTGLAATVVLTISDADESKRSMTLHHDFLREPMLVLTADNLLAGPPQS